MFKITLTLILLLTTSNIVVGQGVRSQLSDREAWVGQPVTLQIHISNAGKFSEPQIPEIEGLEIQQYGEPSRIARSMMAYGRVSKSNSAIYTWHITPKRPGSFIVPPIEIEVDGKARTTSEHPFTAKFSETGDLMYAEIKGPDKRVYVGQPVNMTLKIWLRPYIDPKLQIKLTDANLWQLVSDTSQWGSFLNSVRELAQTRHSPVCNTVQRGGESGANQEYYCYEIEATVYPQRPGPMDTGDVEVWVSYPTGIEVARGRSDLFGNGAFADDLFDTGTFGRNRLTVSGTRPIHVKVTEPKVEVVDVPTTGRPADYRGAVGNYQIIARTRSTSVAAGDPIQLQMVVQGNGPMDLIQAPPLSTLPEFSKDFRIADDAAAGFVQDDAKLFVTTLRPRHDGVAEIPPVPFSFFNPDTETYETVYSDPIPITVTQSESLSLDAIVGKPSRSNEAATDLESSANLNSALDGLPTQLQQYTTREILDGQPNSNRWDWTWFLIGPILYSITLLWVRRSRFATLRNRLRSPTSRIKAAIRNAKSTGEVAEVISQHLQSFPDQELADVMARCNRAAYSPVKGESLADLKSAAYQAVSADRSVRQMNSRSNSPIARSFLLFVVVTSVAAAKPAVIAHEIDRQKLELSSEQQRVVLDEANQLYLKAVESSTDSVSTKNSLDSAIAKYQILLDSGLKNSKLLVNIGNAHLRNEQLGLAIASYEEALFRNPFEEAAQQSLSRARELIGERLEPPPILPQLRDWNRRVPVAWVWTIGMVSWTLFWFMAIGKVILRRKQTGHSQETKHQMSPSATVTTGRLSRGLRFRPMVQFGFFVFALASLISLLVSNNMIFPVNTIVIADAATLHDADGTSFPITGELSLGEHLVTLDERGDWLKVKADGNRTGWIEKSKVYRFGEKLR